MPFHRNSDGTRTFSCRATRLNRCFGLTGADDGRAYNRAVVADSSTGAWATDSLGRFMNGSYFKIHAGGSDPHPCTSTMDAAQQIACLTEADPCSLGIGSRQVAPPASNKALAVGGVFPTDDNVLNLGGPAYPLAGRLYLTTLVGFSNLHGGESELAACFGDSALVRPIMNGLGLYPMPNGAQCMDYPETTNSNTLPLPGCGSATNNNACVTSPPTLGPTRADIQGILNNACTSCHHGLTPPEGLDLTNVGAIIGTQAHQCQNKLRITPGNSALSYLVDKLVGVAQDGGCFSGAAMPPPNAPSLSNYDLLRITNWIDDGAQ
jgi:hypothetical protein